jgi:diaminopimelate decarboxylase
MKPPTIAGLDLWQIAAVAGRTPFFVYDGEAIEQRICMLRRILPASVRLHYAMKANPLPSVVHRVAQHVDGLDVASLREMQLALSTGMPAADISIAGPGKTDPELAAAAVAGVVVNVESAGELARLETLLAADNRQARVALRVNPDFQLRGSGMSMGGGAQQFGIDAECVAEVAGTMRHSRLIGLHLFAGSQNLKADALVQGVTETFRLAGRLAAEVDVDLEELNIGGGLGIPYAPGDEAVDLSAYAEHLGMEVREWQRRFPECRVILELGRYMVGEAGFFVSRVVDKKQSRGKTFLVVDGGLHHHLAASGNFGQLFRKNYPISALTRRASEDQETVNVVGPLCTPLDLLGKDVQLPRCDVGDLVVLHQSGAYGPTASPTGFLSHPEPIELLL